MIQGLVGCTRVKNGEKYIQKWMDSMLILCEFVCVLDDGSMDGTLKILEEYASKNQNVFIQSQKNLPLSQGRDFNTLHDLAYFLKPQWIFSPDVDEFVDEEDYEAFEDLVTKAPDDVKGWSFPFYYHWNKDDVYRGDGIYEFCHVIRLYRFDRDVKPSTRDKHVSMCPEQVNRNLIRKADVRIRHYGYMDPKDRQEKFDYYTLRDSNPLEAGSGGTDYKHLLENGNLYHYPSRQMWKQRNGEPTGSIHSYPFKFSLEGERSGGFVSGSYLPSFSCLDELVIGDDTACSKNNLNKCYQALRGGGRFDIVLKECKYEEGYLYKVLDSVGFKNTEFFSYDGTHVLSYKSTK